MDETLEESPEVMPTLDDIVAKSSLDESDKSTLKAKAVQGQDFPCLSKSDIMGMMKDKENPLGMMACHKIVLFALWWGRRTQER